LLSLIRDSEQSKALNKQRGPMMIIAGSGMATGGRIIHHLKHRLDDPATQVVFTGYQGEGTLGRRLLDGASQVEIHRQPIAVRAKISKLNSLSAHADQEEILTWLKKFKSPPKRTFIVHGEPPAQLALQQKIAQQLGWATSIPAQGQVFDLP
jgi:metallo-beta-lactamase family protein